MGLRESPPGPAPALHPGETPNGALPEVASFFDARAARYDGAYEARGTDGHALRVRTEATLRLLGAVGPGAILDVGMGPGRLCEELARRGWVVSGIDASREMVERARIRLPDAAPRLQQGDVGAVPFAGDSFDAVTGTGVFEYVRDRPRAFAEIARVLRPGGLAVVSIPNPLAVYALFYAVATPTGRLVRRIARRPSHVAPGAGQPVRRARFERLLAAAGLRVETVVYTSFLLVPPPLDRAAPELAGRLAGRFEGSGRRLGGILATQLVFAARLAHEAPRPPPADRRP